MVEKAETKGKVGRWIPILLFLTSFIYLSLLSTRQYTWVFTSSDSGGWLAAATQWMVPQTYGAPIYLLLARFLYILPGPLVPKLTIILSALPASITILLVYLILQRLTHKPLISLISSLVLLGCIVFLVQATTTQYRMMAVMFLTLAFYCYLRGWKNWTMACLGIGTAVHMILASITLFWMIAEYKRWKEWMKSWGIFICCAAIPYSLILVLMATNTPKFLAGGLNINSMVGYWSTTSRTIIGTISVNEFPRRLLNDGRILLAAFGLGLIPLFFWLRHIKKNLTPYAVILIGTIMYVLWYVFTCLDAQTWTYLAFASPSIVILVGLGLKELDVQHLVPVGLSALALISLNGAFMNTVVLAEQQPRATNYVKELKALPDKSIVLVEPGPYSLGLFYVINSGKNLIPLIYPYLDLTVIYGMKDYAPYMNKRWDLKWQAEPDYIMKEEKFLIDKYGDDWPNKPEAVKIFKEAGGMNYGTLEALREGLGRGDVYSAVEDYSVINRCFVAKGDGMVKQITALTGELPAPFVQQKETGHLWKVK